MDGLAQTHVLTTGTVLDATPPRDDDPSRMSRGEFEAWEKLRGRGQYDVVRDQMRFRTQKGVYSVQMPVRFRVQMVNGICYALASDIHRDGKLQ